MATGGGGDSCEAKTLEQLKSDSESRNEEEEEEEPSFLEQPPARYYCLICHSVMRDPHIVMCCCKKMCGTCIERVHHSGQPCPTCREPNFTKFREKQLNSEILDLKVRCTHHTNGCEWVGELRDLKKHTDPEKGKCGFIPVKCPYGCPVAYLRRESDNHESVCTNLPPELQIKRTMRATDQFKEELQVTLERFQELYKSESERVRELTDQLETMKENRKKEEQEMKHQFEAEKKQLLDECRTEYQQQIKLQTENCKKEEQEMKHQFEAEKKQLLDKCHTEYQQQIKLQTENRKKEEQEMKHQFEAEKKQLLDECCTEYQQQIKLLTESLREQFTQEMSKMKKKSEEENQQQMVSLKQRFEKEEKERLGAAKRQLAELQEYYQKELKKNENESKQQRETPQHTEASIEESKVFTGLSKDVLLLMSKVNEGRFKMLQFFPEERKVVVLAASAEEQEKCIQQFQETYQGIIRNRQLKSGDLEVPASFPVEEMFSLLDEFNDKYHQCHFSCDEKARVIRIVSMSSRQFDQAKKLISDQLAEEKGDGKTSKKKEKGGGKDGKGAAGKISTKMGLSEVLEISEGRKLTVKRGNIVDEDVDAIVNEANERLDHVAGVAGALNKATGGQLQRISNDYIKAYGKVPVGEAALTKAGGGKLKCKRVIHAVGPIASLCKSDMMCSDLIFKAITNSLIEAQKMKAATVAFPALSTGIYAVNRHLGADAIFQAMLKFHYASNDVLKDIRIVILDEETYTVFAQHLVAIRSGILHKDEGNDTSSLPTGLGSIDAQYGISQSSSVHDAAASGGLTTNRSFSPPSSSIDALITTQPQITYPSFSDVSTTTTATTTTSSIGTGRGSDLLKQVIFVYESGGGRGGGSIGVGGRGAGRGSVNGGGSSAGGGSVGTVGGGGAGSVGRGGLGSGGGAVGGGESPFGGAVTTIKVNTPKEDEQYSAPPDSSISSNNQNNGKGAIAQNEKAEGCPICLNKELTKPYASPCCKQLFCKSCFATALQHSPYCSVCKRALRNVQGNQPVGGTMTSYVILTSLPGYEGAGTIVIKYTIPSGTQTTEHPSPGKYYHGTSRTAHLPNTPEGQEILKLLKKAFDARLIFTVGTSHTTGQTDTVVWNDIHHKTYMHGEPFGYPDPTYLARVREELKAKGIE